MWSSYGTCSHVCVCVCEESSDKWRNKNSKKESKNGILVSQRKKITGELAVWSGQSEDASLLNKVLLYLWVLMGTAKESLCLVEEEYTKGGMQGQQKVTNSYTWNQDIVYYTQQPAQEIMYSIIVQKLSNNENRTNLKGFWEQNHANCTSYMFLKPAISQHRCQQSWQWG